ncbi:MAG: NAD(P)/FAD-dependent oxidoreductase, partial [Gammaproteobacteria bacterium]|nr:NAD(P)/FAD-dependent oxidoreductase [Gammaproteobacteria bacterium]
SLVIASGGLSIPKMSASPFGYRIAEQFGLKVQPTRAGLVPFTLHEKDKTRFAPLAGVAVDAVVTTKRKSFRENLLFTHRGLSGPAILQASSWWQAGESITINFLPALDLAVELAACKQSQPAQQLKTVLGRHLPKRLVTALVDAQLASTPMQTISGKQIEQVANQLHRLTILPNGTEGYRTAEVTVGGVDCDELSSKTMQANRVAGLYFIGEVVDVTGWLGGYNFQWAWSSGWCAGQVV